MNDLFSNSSKQSQDLEIQAYVDDIDVGGSGVRNETFDLNKFFQDVENMKDDLMVVEKLYKKVQESIEESKMIHNANQMKLFRSKIDSDFTHLLNIAKIIKGKLEALDKSNVEHQTTLGSSADMTRTSMVNDFGNKLRIMTDNFQEMRIQIKDEYKEAIGRTYFALTGEKANDELINNLMSNANVKDLIRKAIQDQDQITDTISEFQERHDANIEIEKNLIELHQIFLDMVEAQGKQLNDIESHVAHTSSFVKGLKRKWRCIAITLIIIFIVLVIICFFVLPALFKLFNYD